MASAISALTGASQNTQSSNSSNAALGGVAPSEEVFLKLLVSQLQNQDPMNPADSTQFVTQLAQFSELEQTIAIRQDIEKNAAAQAAATTQTQNQNQTQTSATTQS